MLATFRDARNEVEEPVTTALKNNISHWGKPLVLAMTLKSWEMMLAHCVAFNATKDIIISHLGRLPFLQARP